MKAAICSIAWKDRLGIFEIVDVAARIGAQGLEVWGQPPHIPDVADADHVARLRDALEERRLAAPQYGSYARAGTDGFAVRAKAELAVTAGLKAPACRMWAGPADSEVMTAPQWKATVADLKTACAMAAEAGLSVTLERHGGTATNTLWGCQRVIDEVSHPALRINYQFMDPAARRIAEEVRLLGRHILNTHATNLRLVGNVQQATRLAEGDVDWALAIRNLQAVGNDGFIEVEFARRGAADLPLPQLESELAADVAFLKQSMAT